MLLAIDLETVNAQGKSDYRWWMPGFAIQSLALSWFEGGQIKSYFTCTPADIEKAVARLSQAGHQLIVQNLSFEKGVLDTLYPHLPLNWYADTMRLAQLWDNGGDWRDQKFNGDELDADSSPSLGDQS